MNTILSPRFVRIHKLSISVVLFLIFISIIHWLKPAFIYNEKGGFRPFGLGYRQSTVFPFWIVSIVMAILAYLLVIIYIRDF